MLQEQRYRGDELEDQASQGAKESQEGAGGLARALLTKILPRDPEHSLGSSREL